MGHMGTGSNTGHFTSSPMGSETTAQGFQGEPSDSLEVYFECITTCSLDDGACVTRCVEQLREQP